MEQIKNLISSVDPKILYGVAIVAVVMLVVSIIKKAVKLVCFLAVIAAAFLVLAPTSSSLREKFNIEAENGAITITVDGEEHTIADKESIENVSFKQLDDDKMNITITYSGRTLDIDVPSATKVIITGFLDKHEIKYEDIEDTTNN